jgi:hypothetical protein
MDRAPWLRRRLGAAAAVGAWLEGMIARHKPRLTPGTKTGNGNEYSK